MTEILAVLGAAALFVVFGLLTRGRRLSCGPEGGSCAAARESCGRCDRNPAVGESEHAEP